MSLTVKKDGQPVEYDSINITGWGCIWLFGPWAIGIIYVITAVVALVGWLTGVVLSSFA